MPETLALILVLLASSVVVVVVCRFVRLPPILGYLIVGLVVGPHALGWVPDDRATRTLAEFGVVFLLFSIGLEFSLAQLKAMRRAVFGLGLAQVGITTAAAMAVLQVGGYGWQHGLVLGGALAMSSTAIVSKMLAERGELASPHGRDIMGVLLFQDLAVVAFLIVIPSLEAEGIALATALSVAGPAKIPAPGPGAGQTAYVFTAVGTPAPATEQKLPLNVTWVNLTTGRSGSATLKPNPAINPEGPTTLTAIVDTGSGSIMSTIFGQVTTLDKQCTFMPTIGSSVVP